MYSSFRHVNENGAPIYPTNMDRQFINYQEKSVEELLGVCFIGVSFMYKTGYAKLAGEYYLQPVEDYDYWLRLTDFCSIAYVPEILMDYRVDSAHSISKHLKTSIYQHRIWRYAFQLAKYQARVRRNIPFETTVVVPITDGDEPTIAGMENLYEQYYSNFKMVIIDLSPTGAGQNSLQHLSDPR